MSGSRENDTVASENWDDDFEFQPGSSAKSANRWLAQNSTAMNQPFPRLSSVSDHPADVCTSELRPSSPPHAVLSDITEHCDEFDVSPARKSIHKRRSFPKNLVYGRDSNVENWDDDFPISARSLQDSPWKRRRHSDCSSPFSSNDELEVNGDSCDEGDHTITSSSRLPVPALLSGLETQLAPFPRSPTVSVFSNPHSSTTGRDSAALFYSSTTHLKTTSSHSNVPVLSAPNPSVHRERRRLRKKSRPPQFEDVACELEDQISSSLPSSLLIDQPNTPPRIPSPIPCPPESLSVSLPRTPLLSRIGSVKQWAARKKRGSISQADIALAKTNDAALLVPSGVPCPPSLSETQSKGSWFFRSNGRSISGESSLPREMTAESECTEDEAPCGTSKSATRKTSGFFFRSKSRDVSDDMGKATLSQPSPATPKDAASSGKSQDIDNQRSPFREGSRGFLKGVRRISFGVDKKHRRSKTSTGFSQEKVVLTDGLSEPSSEQPHLLPSQPAPANRSADIDPPLPSSQTPHLSPSRSPPTRKSTPSPQPVSLGPATNMAALSPVGSLFRRSSLGDLKIPPRIVQAQIGLKRDLEFLKEFATCISHLQDLQATYHSLVRDVHGVADDQHNESRTSSVPFDHRFPVSRGRSNTNPLPQRSLDITASFHTIHSKYRLSWECAQLLIELGRSGASVPNDNIAPPASQETPGETMTDRERTLTLSGDETNLTSLPSLPLSHVPSPQTYRTPIPRQDLGHRQLELLREMLESDIAYHAAGSVNRNSGRDDDINSTIALPDQPSQDLADEKKGPRLGMKRLRDVLRILTRNYATPDIGESLPATYMTSDTLSSQRRPKTMSDLAQSTRSVRDTAYAGITLDSLRKSSPRRPSIASIFRLGQWNKSVASADGSTNTSSNMPSATTTMSSVDAFEEEDWDRMDDVHNVDPLAKSTRVCAEGSAKSTLRDRRRSSHSSKPIPSSRQTQDSRGSAPMPFGGMHPNRLSDVAESVDHHNFPSAHQPSEGSSAPHRKPSTGQRWKTSSIRSAPPNTDVRSPDSALSMTPENIGPLLLNAREVQARCAECISEVKELLEGRST